MACCPQPRRCLHAEPPPWHKAREYGERCAPRHACLHAQGADTFTWLGPLGDCLRTSLAFLRFLYCLEDATPYNLAWASNLLPGVTHLAHQYHVPRLLHKLGAYYASTGESGGRGAEGTARRHGRHRSLPGLPRAFCECRRECACMRRGAQVAHAAQHSIA